MARLINADEVIKRLEAWNTDDPMDQALYRFALSRILEAPTVDAVPVRHGKYIGTEFDGYADGCPVYYEWKCSECGCVFEEEEPTYKYCPNCGADMRGEQDE